MARGDATKVRDGTRHGGATITQHDTRRYATGTRLNSVQHNSTQLRRMQCDETRTRGLGEPLQRTLGLDRGSGPPAILERADQHDPRRRRRNELGRNGTQLTLYKRNGHATLYQWGTRDGAFDRATGLGNTRDFHPCSTRHATPLDLLVFNRPVRPVFREQGRINTQSVS